MEKYGYNSFIQALYDMSKQNGELGRVITQQKTVFDVVCKDGIRSTTINTSLLKSNNLPVIGDWVVVNDTIITEILQRKNMLVKKSSEKKVSKAIIASHIDVVFLIISASNFSFGQLSNMINVANDLNIKIIVNKCDLIDDEELTEIKNVITEKLSMFDTIYTSIYDNGSIELLRSKIEKNNTYTFLGESGVGKSSLINTILSNEVMSVGEVSKKGGKGKHTTTHKQLFVYNNCCIIDIPGLSNFAPWISNSSPLLFSEIEEYAKHCKFNDCTHTSEIGCQVIENVSEQELEEYFAYKNYQLYLKRNESAENYIEYSKNQQKRRNR